MEILKNCPHCGAVATFETSRATFDQLVEDNGSACLRISCTDRKCGACMWVHGDEETSDKVYDELFAKGIRNWNRRAHEV